MAKKKKGGPKKFVATITYTLDAEHSSDATQKLEQEYLQDTLTAWADDAEDVKVVVKEVTE